METFLQRYVFRYTDQRVVGTLGLRQYGLVSAGFRASEV